MRTTITRTITATTIKSGIVAMVKGVPTVTENPILIIMGTLTEEKALKEVRKEYGSLSVVIETNVLDDMYEISVTDFIKYATKVVPETPVTAETETPVTETV